jgi:hypothetical protein
LASEGCGVSGDECRDPACDLAGVPHRHHRTVAPAPVERRDIVVTVPKSFGFAEWIAEGDAAGKRWSGQYWSFYTGGGMPKVALTGKGKYTAGLVGGKPDNTPDNSPGTELVYAHDGEPDTRWLFCEPDQRCYIVAHGRLRGYAPLYAVEVDGDDDEPVRHRLRAFIRRGGAVAVTIPETIRGFRGWRYRFWDRASEVPFSDWRTP